jgi:hypothetical protein
MITLTREEAQQVLDALEDIRYADISDSQRKAIETIQAKLHEYPRHKVTPHEFVATATGKENLIGMPIIWAEWPMREEATGEQQ